MPLAKRTDCGDARYAGVEVPFCCDIVATLEVRRGGCTTIHDLRRPLDIAAECCGTGRRRLCSPATLLARPVAPPAGAELAALRL